MAPGSGEPARSRRAGLRARDPANPRRRAAARSAAPCTRPRKRSAAPRSASSGSTLSLRARLTAANSTSPISWNASSRPSAAFSSSSSASTASYGHVVEVEAAGGRAALHLARVQRPGQVLRHLAEDAGLAAGLGRLDRVPVAQHLAGRLGLDLAEHVRVAADQLLAAVLGDVGQRAGAALLEQQRQEVHLEEHVAELVEQLGVIARVGGRGQLVGLLDRVRDDRALVLLAVPGALAPQPPGQLVEAPERLDVLIGSRAQRAPAGSAACGLAARLRRRRRRLRSVLALLASRSPRGTPCAPSTSSGSR